VNRTTALFEDTTMAYNRWVQGIASRELASTRVNVPQVLNKQPIVDKAPKTMHPVLDKTPEIVGSLILNLTNLSQKVDLALNSNLVKSERKKETLIRLQKKIKKNLRYVSTFITDFESLS